MQGSRIQRCQMFVVRIVQILFNIAVQWCLFVRMFLCFFVNKIGTGIAKEIPDQHAAGR